MFEANKYYTEEEAKQLNDSIKKHDCAIMPAFYKCMVHGYGDSCPTAKLLLEIDKRRENK